MRRRSSTLKAKNKLRAALPDVMEQASPTASCYTRVWVNRGDAHDSYDSIHRSRLLCSRTDGQLFDNRRLRDKQTELQHEGEEVRGFYAELRRRDHVIIGFEGSGYCAWFEELLEELGCEIWFGHAAEIRQLILRARIPASS